ncbi:MAG: sel1 repeat family protein, partial [Magnetococcales bacterium]|nr:sel1 repeat family protein [Magnetococcales bacterium]
IFENEANKGNRFARFNLGVMYLEGVGVEENPVQAYVWFQLAARQGDSLAAQSATIVLKRMTPAQVVESRNILKEKEKNLLRR